jgi:hypothetical protein
VRVFIGRNMGSTLPYVSPPVKLGYDVFAVEVAEIAGRIPCIRVGGRRLIRGYVEEKLGRPWRPDEEAPPAARRTSKQR